MSFFQIDDNNVWGLSNQFWVYWVFAVPITIATVIVWQCWQHWIKFWRYLHITFPDRGHEDPGNGKHSEDAFESRFGH